jgi:hypothetical protein
MKILIIGGYGNFGKRLTINLIDHSSHDIIIAGRSKEKANQFLSSLSVEQAHKCSFSELDIYAPQLDEKLRFINIDIVINAVGPYQLSESSASNYPVPNACLAAACHYIDLADARDYVREFAHLFNDKAAQAGLCFISGASTVPGLSCALLDHFQSKFDAIDSVDYGISPGNRTERGEATVASILSYTGKAILGFQDSKSKTLYGWQDLRRADFGKVLGKRWVSNCDIPDLDILPKRYVGLKNIRFQAGLELSILHLGLWLLSWIRRKGWVKDWSKYSRALTRMSEWFIRFGSDAGGMYLNIEGSKNGRPKSLRWLLIAELGSGPNVPTIAAELCVEKIAQGSLAFGARPCVGVFSLNRFLQVASRWGIYSTARFR